MTRRPDASPLACTFVTYDELPGLDPDDRLAADALARLGVTVRAAVWNDPAVDWAATPACVVRSTWDYPRDVARFSRWIDDTAQQTTVWNAPPALHWNLHKFYLRDLHRRGVPIVPTEFAPRETPLRLDRLLEVRGWAEAVVKPAHGAGTVGVRHVRPDADGQAYLDALLATQDVLVQPYLRSVCEYHERALVFIDGTYSHAVSKTPFQPLLPAGQAGEALAVATPDELAVAEHALAASGSGHLYARVDLVRGDDGTPLVIEVELIEPSLFIAMYAPAATNLARAIAGRLQAEH